MLSLSAPRHTAGLLDEVAAALGGIAPTARRWVVQLDSVFHERSGALKTLSRRPQVWGTILAMVSCAPLYHRFG